MANMNTEEKIQKFFDSVLETLEMSKLYIFDPDEIRKIQINVNLVSAMRRNPFYFNETPFYALGYGMTSCGFRKFDKTGSSLFTVFSNILNKIFVYRNRKDLTAVAELLSSLESWNTVKPKNYIQNLIHTVVPKSFFAEKLQNTY